MAKSASRFAWQECGAAWPKWAGRCEACGAWNSLIEELPHSGPPKSLSGGSGKKGGYALDFVGADPGIGRSTLLLQAAAAVAAGGGSAAYITGEEAINQIRLRARRLGVA